MTEEYKCPHKSRRKVICTCITIFLLLVGATALTLWLVYRPHNPQFKIIGIAIYELNYSAAPLVTTNMQFTVVTRNPNKRISIYYDRLSVSVWYRNQAITPQVMLPPFFHKHHRTVTVSPVLGGGEIPVSVEVANGLVMDEADGVMGLSLVLLGRLRWKVGAIKTTHYGIYVKCDVLLGLKKGFVGQVPLLGSPAGCKVDI
ncbi:NDR1/HIN1-like protein 12 [Juglans microcarpa x Juglans regia]|uniref:NDR1/HIN1-like protein 12 n=1 Tax=Juglans microcarpa x Juglans regia TaxID=2249226 RepID=UPI001B7F607C|nr:NDR1/HIN1-like protein 12 [Juglans microcarpa x Juglans regia]